YSLVASPAALSSRVRTKKGVLPKDLAKLPSCMFEQRCEDGRTRLAALVDLSGASLVSTAHEPLLNWLGSLFVLTDLTFDELCDRARFWVATDPKSVFSLSYPCVIRDLFTLDATAILRYLPADNGHDEVLSVLGNADHVQRRISHCMKELAKVSLDTPYSAG